MIKKVIIILSIIAASFIAGFISNHLISRFFIYKHNNEDAFINDVNDAEEIYLNNKAPDITAMTLDGNVWKINDYKGKIVVLHFWSGACASCDFMNFKLDKLFEQYNKNDYLVIAGIPNIYDEEIIKCYVKTKNIKWVQLFDEEAGYEKSLVNRFKVYSFPSIWVIDKEGIVRGVNIREIGELEKIVEREIKK